MRLDKFLKVSRIIKRRTLSKEMSEASRVKVNGKVAKPSTQLKIDDIIEVEFGRSILVVKVKELREHVLKDDSNFQLVDMKYCHHVTSQYDHLDQPYIHLNSLQYIK